MKRTVSIILMCLLLSGCSTGNEELEQVMAFRAGLLAAMGCSFDAVVTADYQDAVYTFGMSCRSDELGGVTFTVTEPESISGIEGRITAEGGKLTFDEEALAFELMADDQLTPVSTPWLLVKTLRGGYVTACGKDGDRIRASIDDSYDDDALRLDVWFRAGKPEFAEVLYDGRRILSLEVKNFAFV